MAEKLKERNEVEEGLLREGVRELLVKEIMSLSEEEVQLVLRLLTS